MAFIEGIASSRELEIVRDADYEIVEEREDDEGYSWIRVWVDCDITDLLSPPLCKFCGRLMETYSDIGSVNCWGIKVSRVSNNVVHGCPNCGAWVQVCTHPPEE